MTTTARATGLSRNGYQVVSAINGSFFNMSVRTPVNLISHNNKLLNVGAVSKSKNSYVNQPNAFGILANGDADIDYYRLSLKANINSINKTIIGMNRARNIDELILYTLS